MRMAQGMDQDVPLEGAFDQMWSEMEEFKGVPLGMEMSMEAELDSEQKAEMQRAQREKATRIANIAVPTEIEKEPRPRATR